MRGAVRGKNRGWRRRSNVKKGKKQNTKHKKNRIGALTKAEPGEGTGFKPYDPGDQDGALFPGKGSIKSVRGSEGKKMMASRKTKVVLFSIGQKGGTSVSDLRKPSQPARQQSREWRQITSGSSKRNNSSVVAGARTRNGERNVERDCGKADKTARVDRTKGDLGLRSNESRGLKGKRSVFAGIRKEKKYRIKNEIVGIL